MSQQLIKYEAACRALRESHSVVEALDIRDIALFYRFLAHCVVDRPAEIDWSEVVIRSERRIGQLIEAAK